MTDTRDPGRRVSPRLLQGLSGKVLALTVIFVMLGEVLIFLPSIANFRIQWLKSHVAMAEIAALAAKASPDEMLSQDLKSEVLQSAGVLAVSLTKNGARQLLIRSDDPRMVEQSYDIRRIEWWPAISNALAAMWHGDDRVIGVTDIPPNMAGDLIEIAVEEAPLRAAMLNFAFRILILSVILSLMVAGLVFAALNRVLVRPMQRLTANMVAFAANPEEPGRIITPSARSDEIGIAERELEAMQRDLISMLQQRNRLAAVGLAVSKVSHDLRNMLSSAHLISDRMSLVEDATIQRFAPKLIASLDRAIDFLTQTLKFGRAEEPPPLREKFDLKPLVDEVIDQAAVQAASHIVLYNNVPASLIADADREQLNRVLTNLARNSIQALEVREAEGGRLVDGAVTFRAWREGAVVSIEVRDNGPGIPDKVRDRLFQPFQSSTRAGGTGLGLTIAMELTRAHGGRVALSATGPEGTVFVVSLPDTVVELRSGRRGERKA